VQEVEVSLSFSSLVSITAALLLAGVVFWIFGSATSMLIKIGIGVVLAAALDPLISALRRRGWSRTRAATSVALGLLLAVGLVVTVVGPQAVDQARETEKDLPKTVEGLYSLPVVGSWLEKNDASDKARRWVENLPSSIDDETVSHTLESFVTSVATAVIVLAVAFAVMLDGELLVARGRRLLPPSRRPAADRMGRIMYSTFGRYFGGSLTVAVLAGLDALILCLVLKVPLAPVAAIWVMITDLIPQVGGFLGGSLIAILALSASPGIAIIAVLWFVLYMNFENNVIQPAVVGKAVNLTPPTTMMAAFIGGAVAGVPGALVATPLVGTVKRLYFVFVRGEDNLADNGS
jgi:predicted PurR-regulated permease PerM